jgi:hypothetical protein
VHGHTVLAVHRAGAGHSAEDVHKVYVRAA